MVQEIRNRLIIFSRQTGSITRRVVERWLQTATKVSRHKHLPVCFGSESIFRTPRFEPFGARRDMPELVAQDALEDARARSEEHTSELQSLMRISYAVFGLKKTKAVCKLH